MLQGSFKLQPKNYYDLSYLIPHSGIRESIDALFSTQGDPIPVFVFGPEGCGKTHLIEAFRETTSIRSDYLSIDDFSVQCPTLLSRYEQARASGTKLLVECHQTQCDDPHVVSRIKNGLSLYLNYPQDEELPAVLQAIAERKQIKLNLKAKRRAIRKLPKNLHVVERVLSELFDGSLQEHAKSGERFLDKILRKFL